MAIVEFFASHPVFTQEEFNLYLLKQGQANVFTRKALLAYHKNVGHIIQIRKGFYASVPAVVGKREATNFIVDPILISGKIKSDSILAYHTSLSYYGYYYSVYNEFYFLSKHQIRDFDFQNNHFRRVQHPIKLSKMHQENFGIEEADRAGLKIKVTSLERTLVDVLDRPEYGGGWEEIWRSFEMVPALHLDNVIEYALLLDNATTVAKLGFFLEQHRESFEVDEIYLNMLQKKVPGKSNYLERSNRSGGKYMKRWNLIVPNKVLNKSWEEPNEIF